MGREGKALPELRALPPLGVLNWNVKIAWAGKAAASANSSSRNPMEVQLPDGGEGWEHHWLHSLA